MSKKIKKACLAFALAALVGVSAGVSACGTSKHPTVRITIEFREETYVIDYMLYRNMYPQTVQHFIELADAGFYDNMIIHDYKSSDWVTGAYSYNEGYTDGELIDYSESYPGTSMGDYLDANCKEAAYYDLVTKGILDGSFTPSVYDGAIPDTDKAGNTVLSKKYALPTVIGEFANNGHKVEDDKGLTASYGTLKMVYYKKDVKSVFVEDSFGEVMYRDYGNNCATSLFAMQVTDSSSLYASNNYAVFGQLKNDDAKSALEDLTDALDTYISELGSTSSWSKSVSTFVDRLDEYADEGGRSIEVSFTMTSVPIIIKSVEVTKH